MHPGKGNSEDGCPEKEKSLKYLKRIAGALKKLAKGELDDENHKRKDRKALKIKGFCDLGLAMILIVGTLLMCLGYMGRGRVRLSLTDGRKR